MCVISHEPKSSVSRVEAIKRLAVVPAAALGVAAAMSPAMAADNKKQFKYQDTPKGGQKCSGCSLFIAPAKCKVVTGKISPNGWCVAYAAKH